jgi:protein-tyrosine kinase
MSMMNAIPLTSGSTPDRLIGAILMETGKLSAQDAERVVALQKEEGLRFGDAAVQLGVLTHDDIQYALARQYGYPYLRFSEDRAQVAEEVIAAYQPYSREAESIRALRSQLKMRWFTGELARRTLAIVSVEKSVGRSYLAANLAVVFAQLGERTLLIDADMRSPRQHTLFHLENRSGLSSILANRAKDRELRQVPALPDLHVLTAGPTPPNPQELLSRPAFDAYLDQVSTEFDVILIDTPAATHYADAQIIAGKARGALLATRKDRTRLTATRQLCASFSHLGVAMVGSVLNEF